MLARRLAETTAFLRLSLESRVPAAELIQPLRGRIALVLAATSPAASAAAEALAEAGTKVMLNYSEQRHRAEQLAERIRNKRGQAMIFQADVAQPDQMTSLCDVLTAYWGRLDILVDDSGLHADAVRTAMRAARSTELIVFDCTGLFRYLAGLSRPDGSTEQP
ncbi:SDR family NAD(P)-dependent oxidoreductase [Methylomonas sp. SURF-2]|uniref:SDR family NAD(P)-dependent oxidoreductase n=1 Tax=Methylomonas subterranea TaxID=2952225 RepID=A0ABT1TG54_9GAMM|nr:SDR family NAD(P)-dependent oxidoreductase [Methylomonas sp. SURF-2]MCQ8104441.1 SDR family NAD(P)-dependent oxidoreductase [Methylomonas sp. SURF-2]